MRKGRAGFVLLLDHRDEVIELDRAEVLATAGANRHATGLLFLLAHDENVRNLLQAQFADFIVNLFAAQIRLHADAGSVKLGGDFVGVVLLGVRDAGGILLDLTQEPLQYLHAVKLSVLLITFNNFFLLILGSDILL